DLLFGVLLAFLPVFSKADTEIFTTMGHLILSFMFFGVFSFLIAKIPISWFLKPLKGSNNNELFILGSISMCLLMSQVSLTLGIGAEIGCFVAGMLIHNCRSIFEFSISVVEPVSDVFSCLFFASIGLHVYPSFLVNEGSLLFILTLGAIGFKFLSSSVTLMTFGHTSQRAVTMAIGMSQISEFVFVLASRAKDLEIISREVYYLLLTTASLTLMVIPIFWSILLRLNTNFITTYKPTINESECIPFTNNIEKVE
ncbi:18747_t:CDS:2, partial [Acaulospora morrowiae]